MSKPSTSTGFGLLFCGVLSVLCGVTVAFVVAEVALWVIVPTRLEYRAIQPGLEVTFDAGRYAKGVEGPALFKVNAMGVRGREWSTDRQSEYRILALGGSTTESLLNDQRRIWTTLLEQKLGHMVDGRQVWVGNIGRAGLGTPHHIVQLKHLDMYDPDLIIALVGSSDFMSRLKLGEHDNPMSLKAVADQRTLEEQAFAIVPDVSLLEPPGPWYRHTRLWGLGAQLSQLVLGRSKVQDREGRSLERWRAMRASGKRSNVLPSLDSALDGYDRNLREMVHLARDAGVPILLMTQPSIWRDDLTHAEEAQLWMGGVGEFRDVPGSVYYGPEALEQGMDAFNQRLLQVCREAGTPCLDLAKAIPKSVEYFYDDEHFTDKGQELVAASIAERVRELPR